MLKFLLAALLALVLPSLAQAEADPDGYLVIDARADVETVTAELFARLEDRLVAQPWG